MKFLLDTCTFLWWVDSPTKLSKRCRELCTDPNNEVFLSVVSAWEITIKHAMRRLILTQPPERYIPHYRAIHQITPLPLDEASTLQLSRLPGHHKDPFDRMLVCQAIENGLTLLTPDPLITQYPVRTEW